MASARLASGKQFSLDPGATILESAKRAGLALPYSCKTGRCRVCKARVTKGMTLSLRTEESLSAAEREAGYILTCCRTADENVSLDINDIGEFADQQQKILPCRIDSITRARYDIAIVILRTPPRQTLNYLPGQHVSVAIPGGVKRSYSIANCARADGKLELHIRAVAGGVASEYWFKRAAPNDLLYLEGPLGTFAIARGRFDRLIFLATGTGIAPVKAMLEGEAGNAARAIGSKKLVAWGAREPDEFYWRADLASAEIDVVRTLSRASDTWRGEVGYVQDAVLRRFTDWDRTAVYACGSAKMIESACNALVLAGLPAKSFHSDAFVAS